MHIQGLDYVRFLHDRSREFWCDGEETSTKPVGESGVAGATSPSEPKGQHSSESAAAAEQNSGNSGPTQSPV
jgi:hypothetical protein